MNLNGINKATESLGKVVYKTKSPAFLPFEHWLMQASLDTAKKAKNQRKVASIATSLAKEAANAFDEVKQTFTCFLEKHKLDKTVELLSRPKSIKGAANKANMVTREMYRGVRKEISHLKDLKLDINDILPANNAKVSDKFRKIYDETRELLAQKAHKDMLGLDDLRTVVNKEQFVQKYGKDGAVFVRKFNKKIQRLTSSKIHNIFENVNKAEEAISGSTKVPGQKQIASEVKGFANEPDAVSKELRDMVGVRFVIKNPRIVAHKKGSQRAKIRNHMLQKHYMEKQTKRITDMFIDMHQSKIADMKKVTLYGGNDTYLKTANVQRIQALGGGEDGVNISKLKTLPNHYVTTQGNMVMKTSTSKKPMKVEWQVRGEKVNKFADIEHIPYDLREGKSLDLSKFNKEQKALICKIQKVARNLSKDESLSKKYDAYLADCYDYYFAKEHGIAKPAPVLPNGIDHILSKESLMKLSLH